MLSKFSKLTMLSTLLSVALGFGVTRGVSNTLSAPSKTTVAYTSEDTINDHDTSHSTDYNWVSFSSSGYGTGSITGGNSESAMSYYYLEDAVNLSTNLTISNYVTICLNGYSLEGNGSGIVITVSNSGYFNLCDCSSDSSGTITGGRTTSIMDEGGGGVYISSNATFNMYGGTITDNSSTYGYGAGVFINSNGTFNMNGGTISDNSAYGGAGVFVSVNASFNMYDGTISNNTATTGGGVFVYQTFTMNGGTISSNTASSQGGGVYVYNNCTFEMYDGTITGNEASLSGGAVYLMQNASYTMHDGTISSNTATSEADSVYLNSDSTFTMYEGYLSGDFYKYDDSGTVSISRGYFSFDPTDYLVDADAIVVEISMFGREFDEDYVDGFDYAVYTISSITYGVSDIFGITYGTTYTLTITGDYTGVSYTWVNEANSTSGYGLPTEPGENYAVTAHFLLKTTSGDTTTNYYGTDTFAVTILKGQAQISVSSNSKEYDGEAVSLDYAVTVGNTTITDGVTVTWYDENGAEISAPTEAGTYKVTITVEGTDYYNGASLDVEYTITEESSSSNGDNGDNDNNRAGLSTWMIVAIAVGSVVVVGLIVLVLLYLLVFRKRRIRTIK